VQADAATPLRANRGGRDSGAERVGGNSGAQCKAGRTLLYAAKLPMIVRETCLVPATPGWVGSAIRVVTRRVANNLHEEERAKNRWPAVRAATLPLQSRMVWVAQLQTNHQGYVKEGSAGALDYEAPDRSWMIFTSARSALFTAALSGKTSATSGSSRTMFVPSA